MSFVSLGGDGLRPTFFELVAAERLMPSLKAAITYSLSVYAQRRPGLNRLLDHEDELFFLISVLLDRQSLHSNQASFAESLYALKRAPASPASGSSKEPMSPAQRQTSLMLLTLVPFLRAKLDALYQRLLVQRQQRQGAWALSQANGSYYPQQQPQQQQAALDRLHRLALRAFVQVYPWVHAAHEGVRFAYQLLYLLDATPYYSPSLHLLRLVVVRVAGQEMLEHEQGRQQRRQERLTAAQRRGGPWLLQLLRRGWLRAGELATDHTRSVLILSVFAFKLLEWWYTSAEQRLGGSKALPPPPPPPAPRPSPQGVPLPPDVSLCPLCRRSRTNPAMVAVSGYVFCYTCVHPFVSQEGCCPVTRVPCGVEHIRRLYQGM
ncbi:hypothetical protein N2152v2_003933 [Parachlorella kessleri]